MFLRELNKEIENWVADESAFIRIPHDQKVISRSEVYQLICQIKGIINIGERENDRLVIGLCFEDPKNWVISILAAQLQNFVVVPIPQEFTVVQIASFAPNLDFVLTDSLAAAKRLEQIFAGSVRTTSHSYANESQIFLLKQTSDSPVPRLGLPVSAVSVIHTSGSTDNPKGVVISEQGLGQVVYSMRERVTSLGPMHYLSILPYSLLLEQVLGLYLPILTKGSVTLLPRSVGCYTGTQNFLAPYLEIFEKSQSNFSMVPPSFLAELQKLAVKSHKSPRACLGEHLKVLATGGAPIDMSSLEYFKEHGIDIFQGYGLSENTSVVAWNYPGPNVLGSVGKPLKHNQVRINSKSQVEVSGNAVFLGYVTRGSFSLREESWLNTGDVGYFDSAGYLYVTGRDANLIVLSSGRNVAPEWIEGKLRSRPGIKDVLVVGHGKPFLSAIILVEKSADSKSVLNDTIRYYESIANQFPDFARVRAFRAVSFEDRFYSVSGRILRSRVLENYTDLIKDIYSDIESRGINECKTIS